jgi:hypothetical protein
LTTSPEQIAYEAAVRAVEHQARQLDELRSRTGLLVAAAAVAGSLLGARALAEPWDGLALWASIAFGVCIALCMAILVPWWFAWYFTFNARILLEDWADEPRRGGAMPMQRWMAESLQTHWRGNSRRLAWMYGTFTVAVLALAAEVTLWTVKLAHGGG